MRLHSNTGWSGPVVHTWMTLSPSVEVPTVLSSLVRAAVMSTELDCAGESCVCWGVVFTSDRILPAIDSCMFCTMSCDFDCFVVCLEPWKGSS